MNANNNSNTLNNCVAATYNWTVSYTPAYCGNTSSWSFTNGTNSTSINPKFQFSAAGIYTITLDVTNPCGTFSVSHNVDVKQPPQASFLSIPSSCTNPYVIDPTTYLNLTNCGTQALTYNWTFNGGTPSSSTSASPGNISFSGVGSHTITLAVTNECGTTTISTTVVITNPPSAPCRL